ncbi:MAG: recombinase [Chitinophagaceae bacterium]|nr:recombinase [Chitinophagaceae bacterium]
MYVQLNEGIAVDVKPLPKKQKAKESRYNIYLKFSIYQNGILQLSPVISTGLTVEVKEWDKDKMKGNSDKAKLINERLNKYMGLSIKSLEYMALNDSINITCNRIAKEVHTTIRPKITGKAPRGLKGDFQIKAQEYTLNNVLQLYFKKEDAPCEKRQTIYVRAIELLHEYFNNETPLINNISSSDLENFKNWYQRKYSKSIKQNTSTTYFAMIAAVFLFAYKKLKIIKPHPLPENFRGSFVDGKRSILSNNDVKQIISLNDETLSVTDRRAKYCMILQLLTGIGYGDLKTLSRSNRRYDTDLQKWIITKNRNKTGVEFSIRQTDMCNYVYDTLREISGGEETEFSLPSIDYMLRRYKEVAQKAGVKVKVTTYTMRHSFAQDFMNNGGMLEELQKMLGHSKITTTQTYGKISAVRIDAAMTRLEQKSERHQYQNIATITNNNKPIINYEKTNSNI